MRILPLDETREREREREIKHVTKCVFNNVNVTTLLKISRP
jgi:hypothetical protein